MRRSALRGIIVAAWLGMAAGGAHADPPSLAAYGRLPVMEHVALSPSGERFAFVAAVNGARKLYVRTVAGVPLAVSSVDGVKVRDVDWAGDDFVIVTTSDHDNTQLTLGRDYEVFHLYSLNVRTREVRSLLAGSSAVDWVMGRYGYARQDGRWLAYLGALKKTSDGWGTHLDDYAEDLVRVELETGKVRQVLEGTEKGDGWLVGVDGAVLANARFDDRRGEWSLYAGPRRGRLIVADPDPHHSNGICGAGRAPDTVLYATHDDDGGVRFFEARLSENLAPTEVFQDVDVEGLIHHRETGLLTGIVEDGDVPSPRLFDAALQKRIAATRKAFPGLRVIFGSWTDDFGRMIVHTDGPGDSGTFWIVDIATGKAEDLGEDYPGVPPASVGAVQVVDYKAADGMALHGILTLPPGREPKDLPLVVLPHGGPEARDYPHFDWWAQAHASRGYAVWQPNFRGSSGYGLDYRNAGFGEWGGRMQTDVSDGVAELARRGVVDPERACIVGASYGGYAALAGVTLQQGLYRCAVSYSGPSDLKPLLREVRGRSGESAVRYFLRYLGSTSAWDKLLDDRSPARLAGRADAPVLLIHGRDDTVVPFEQSRLMRKALQAADKPVEMLELEGEDHWLSRERTRIAMLDRIEAFVERHNPP